MKSSLRVTTEKEPRPALQGPVLAWSSNMDSVTSRFLHQLVQEIGKGQEFNLCLLKGERQAPDQVFDSLQIEFESIDIAHDMPKAQVFVYGSGNSC